MSDSSGSEAGGTDELGPLWQQLIEDLPASQRAWLTASKPVTVHESTVIVAVPDDFTRSQLESRLRPRLEHALSEALGRSVHLAVTVDATLPADALEDAGDFGALSGMGPGEPSTENPTHPQGDMSTNRSLDISGLERERSAMGTAPAPSELASPAFSSAGPTPVPAGPPTPSAGKPAQTVAETRLNPKYVFDSFVIGSSNRFAHAAAVAVAEAPGRAYNPLLIYGESGLGKTHMLHAIGHYVRNLFSGARVRYVSSEEFTNDFINAIRDDRAASFQRRYRDVDVLLIDDIQFLEGKIQTQEEFFHTFNTLHNANKQIVITSDRPPKRLEALENRLRNRFEWGLITDVQPPDLETRIAILRKKAATERLTAPAEVLEFIASKIQTNIRELEGALIRVTAFASLNRQDVDLTLAEIVLKDLIPEGAEPEITAGAIIAQTSAYFGLSIDDLCGQSRSRLLVTARQIAMYLCRELTELSLPKIGQQFGGRDHTTVMHAERKIRQLMAERRSVYNQVTELTNRIKQQARQS
ncbi:MAG: chromosomal replication initiator protein DnaA [Actinomycetota bacterium]|nr:chromosomal replication initiator protein DnaA [Actinomycetota bacterium]